MPHARAALPALAAAALLAGCGRPLLAAELSVPHVEITTPVQTIDPAVATTDLCAAAPPCLLTETAYDVGGEVPFVTDPGVTLDVRLTAFALHLSPASSLTGVQWVRVVAIHPGTGARTVVASYQKPPALADMPAEILVSGNSNIALAPYLAEGRIDARLEIGYLLGAPVGTFDVVTEAAFSVDVIVEYDAFL
jgi:hypothetical protein